VYPRWTLLSVDLPHRARRHTQISCHSVRELALRGRCDATPLRRSHVPERISSISLTPGTPSCRGTIYLIRAAVPCAVHPLRSPGSILLLPSPAMANPGAGAASSSLLVLLLVAVFAGDNRAVSFSSCTYTLTSRSQELP
jgi:hypothetical protein